MSKHEFKCVLLTTGKHATGVCDLGCWYPVNGRSHARQTDRKNETRPDLLHVRTDGLSKNTKANPWPCRDPLRETTDPRRPQPSSFTLCRFVAAYPVAARCRAERHLDFLFSSAEMVARNVRLKSQFLTSLWQLGVFAATHCSENDVRLQMVCISIELGL